MIILLSGGIDSTASVYYYRELKYSVTAVFVDYGQAANKIEIESARSVAAYYKIKLENVSFMSGSIYYQGEIPGRNGFLVFAAILSHPNYVGIVSLGIHSGTPYYDCSPDFVERMNILLKRYTMGRIILDAPFLKWDKSMIHRYCIDNEIPLEMTYSCENGTIPPCGTCNSCLDRKALNVG